MNTPSSTPSEDKTAALQDILIRLHFEEKYGDEPIEELKEDMPEQCIAVIAEAEQAIRNWCIAQLPEKHENTTIERSSYDSGFNKAIDTATTNLKGDDHD